MKQSLETKADQLLTDVSGIIKRFEEQWRKTGEKYNIFKVAGIDHREVVMCRVLADLMNPQGKHCKGNRYLSLFLDTLPQKLKDKLNFKRTTVTTEYSIPDGRRIDIVLEDGKIFVPIEVKIRAGDLPNQVHDYFKFAKKQNKGDHVPLIYLTIDGHEPADFSKKGLGKNDYVTISFKEEILAWLEACERKNKESKEETAVPIQENLKQLIAAIKSLCGELEDAKMKDEILELVINNDATAAALAIRDAMNTDFGGMAKKEFKEQIFSRVRKEFQDASEYIDSVYYAIQIPIKDGNYNLGVDYTWEAFYVEVRAKKERDPQLEESMAKKMATLTKCETEKDGRGRNFFWEGGCYDGLADDDLYLYRLYKLYTERPQEVADRIIKMANALNNA
jgi:hypothetical protein